MGTPAPHLTRDSSPVHPAVSHCFMSDLIIMPAGAAEATAAPESVQGAYPAGKALAGLLCLVFAVVLPAWWLVPARTSAAPQLADLSDAMLAEIRTISGAVVMSGEFRNRVDSLGNIEKDAALLGSRRERVIGEIEVEIPRADAADPRQELEVDVISLEPRTTYHVYINDRSVAMFTTDDRGSVDVEFVSGTLTSR